jgi:hypothetical protein
MRKNGAPDWIRTSDLCLRRATLYPAELRVQRAFMGSLSGVVFQHHLGSRGRDRHFGVVGGDAFNLNAKRLVL